MIALGRRLLVKNAFGQRGARFCSQTQHPFDDYVKQFWDDSVSETHPQVQKLCQGLEKGSRASLAEAITLVESTHPTKRAVGRLVLAQILRRSQERAAHATQQHLIFRIGVSGAPGVGKSSFLESLGKFLIEEEKKRVAVLTVDPSSAVTGGSVLGDITRMPELARSAHAFVRSSPTRGSLGGLARGTREAMLLCEGAGYDVVLIETVGVGQSEIAVADMVDMFVLLLSPAQGDELQGIKRGIIEKTDLLLITKADGSLASQARLTKAEYVSALKYLRPRLDCWKPRAITVSAHTGHGIDETWKIMCEFWKSILTSGHLERLRKEQLAKWMWEHIDYHLMPLFKKHPTVLNTVPHLYEKLGKGLITPSMAAEELLRTFMGSK